MICRNETGLVSHFSRAATEFWKLVENRSLNCLKPRRNTHNETEQLVHFTASAKFCAQHIHCRKTQNRFDINGYRPLMNTAKIQLIILLYNSMLIFFICYQWCLFGHKWSNIVFPGTILTNCFSTDPFIFCQQSGYHQECYVLNVPYTSCVFLTLFL